MKRDRFIWIVITAVLAALICACSLEIRIHGKTGNGHVTCERRAASGFNGVVLNGVGDVTIYPAEKYKVIVRIDSNLQNEVDTWVDDDCLYIDTNSGVLNPTELTIQVYLPELQTVKLKGTGDMNIAHGNSTYLKIVLSGLGNIDARNYQVEDSSVTLSGMGDIKVWATETLYGTISGVGDIRYKGSPSIGVTTNGIGSIQKL